MTTENTALSREERLEKSKQKSIIRKKIQANEKAEKKRVIAALKTSDINLRYWHLGEGWTVSFGYQEQGLVGSTGNFSTGYKVCFTIKSPADKFSRPVARENILYGFENEANIIECKFNPQAVFVSDLAYETVMHIKLTFLLTAIMHPNQECFSKKFIRFLRETYLPMNPFFD